MSESRVTTSTDHSCAATEPQGVISIGAGFYFVRDSLRLLSPLHRLKPHSSRRGSVWERSRSPSRRVQGDKAETRCAFEQTPNAAAVHELQPLTCARRAAPQPAVRRHPGHGARRREEAGPGPGPGPLLVVTLRRRSRRTDGCRDPDSVPADCCTGGHYWSFCGTSVCSGRERPEGGAVGQLLACFKFCVSSQRHIGYNQLHNKSHNNKIQNKCPEIKEQPVVQVPERWFPPRLMSSVLQFHVVTFKTCQVKQRRYKKV